VKTISYYLSKEGEKRRRFTY